MSPGKLPVEDKETSPNKIGEDKPKKLDLAGLLAGVKKVQNESK